MDLDDTYGQVYCLVICHGLRWHIWVDVSLSGMSWTKLTHMVRYIT